VFRGVGGELTIGYAAGRAVGWIGFAVRSGLNQIFTPPLVGSAYLLYG
jgi:hypothetical protein